jgi:hypothetical protein
MACDTYVVEKATSSRGDESVECIEYSLTPELTPSMQSCKPQSMLCHSALPHHVTNGFLSVAG